MPVNGPGTGHAHSTGENTETYVSNLFQRPAKGRGMVLTQVYLGSKMPLHNHNFTRETQYYLVIQGFLLELADLFTLSATLAVCYTANGKCPSKSVKDFHLTEVCWLQAI